MPNIQGGGAQFLPQNIQRQGPTQQNQAAQANKTTSPEAAKDTVRLQAAPSQTTVSSQIVQRLTSDSTRANIHQLIQQQNVQVPEQKPQLQMLQKPAMSSALAEMLSQHQRPESAQQSQTAGLAQNQQAQLAGGAMQAASFSKIRKDPEDTAERNSQQSGKRVRKEEQEGEFGSLMDMSDEGGMGGDGTHQDQRSDSQKKKPLLQAQKKSLQNLKSGVPTKPGIKMTGPRSATSQPHNTIKKPQPKAPVKPSITNVNSLQSQAKKIPPKPKTDEWDF